MQATANSDAQPDNVGGKHCTSADADSAAGVGSIESVASKLIFHQAARGGHAEQLASLVETGAFRYVDEQDTWGLAALHSASLAGHSEAVGVLLQSRASVNACSARGQTALHLACTENHGNVVGLLLSARADVAIRTAYGNTACELAQRHGTSSWCVDLINVECRRRWLMAEDEIKEIELRLAEAKGIRQIMEEQLGGPPKLDGPDEAAAAVQRSPATLAEETPANDGFSEVPESAPSERSLDTSPRPSIASLTTTKKFAMSWERKREKKKDGLPTYWQTAAKAVAEIREGCEAVAGRASLRPAPAADPFPHRGGLVVTGRVLAEIDPEDTELLAGFERLQTAAAAERRRELRWASRRKRSSSEQGHGDENGTVDEEQIIKEQAVLESTGKPQKIWDELVAQLLAPGRAWDWSKIEVLERRREEDRGKTPGVFAAGKSKIRGQEPQPPAFYEGDIVGPLGGVLRRRARYEQLYYAQQKWSIHDPQAYELKLRAKTTELRMEPLVIDLTAGGSQNRLRHLADVRNDPLRLRRLQAPAAPAQFGMAAGLGRPRSAMPRPRSRPSTPRAQTEPTATGLVAATVNSMAAADLGASASRKLSPTTAAGSSAQQLAATVSGGSPLASRKLSPTAAAGSLAQQLTATVSGGSPLGRTLSQSRLQSPLAATANSMKAELGKSTTGGATVEKEMLLAASMQEGSMLATPTVSARAAAAEAAANVEVVEVLVEGWPYVFVVTLRAIVPGEELVVDFGQEHWEASNFTLARLSDASQIGRALIAGTKTEEEIVRPPEEAPLETFPERSPMRRAQFVKPDLHTDPAGDVV